MAGSLGSLSISIEANMARFQSEMTKSAYITEQAMNKMAAGADLAKTAIKGLATGLIAGLAANGLSAVTTAINSTIDSFAKLDDMTQKTGASVEGLSKLSKVAVTFGQDFAEVDAALIKLAKGMNGVDEESSKVKAGLQAIGISTKDLKSQDPGEVFVQVARKLQEYKDGASKTALVIDVLGKSAANLLPYMNDVADNIERFKGISSEAAASAAAYQDQLGLLRGRHTELVQSIVGAALPAMLDFTKALLDSKEEGKKLFADDSITKWADLGAKAAAYMVDSFTRAIAIIQMTGSTIAGVLSSVALAVKGDFSGASAAFGATGKELQANFDSFMQKKTMMQRVTEEIAGRPDRARSKEEDSRDSAMMKALGFKSGKKDLPYTSPKAAGAAGATDDPARKQRDLALKQIENALAAERDAIKFHDDYISELRSQDLIDYKTYEAEMKSSRDASLAAAIAAYDKEIAVAKQHQAKTSNRKEKADDDIKIEEARAKRAKAIQDAGQGEVLATLKQTAAQSELKKVMEDWNRQQALSLDQMQADVDMMGMSQVEIAKLIAARRILLDVEEQIRRAKEKGNVSDDALDGYRKQAADAIARSNSVYDAGDAKAKDPYFNMRESVRRYGEEAQNVGQQIGQAMTNAFHGAEDALVNFAMTGKLSFGDLARSILADLTRIQAKNLVVALAGSGGTAGGGIIGSLFANIAGARADGGPVNGGSSYIVGERGPEVFKAPSSGTIIPNEALQGGSSSMPSIIIHQTNHIDSRTDQGAIAQIMQRTKAETKAEITREMQRSRNAYAR